jgi:hypothetical protein
MISMGNGRNQGTGTDAACVCYISLNQESGKWDLQLVSLPDSMTFVSMPQVYLKWTGFLVQSDFSSSRLDNFSALNIKLKVITIVYSNFETKYVLYRSSSSRSA